MLYIIRSRNVVSLLSISLIALIPWTKFLKKYPSSSSQSMNLDWYGTSGSSSTDSETTNAKEEEYNIGNSCENQRSTYKERQKLLRATCQKFNWEMKGHRRKVRLLANLSFEFATVQLDN